jgi:hypothetical protein
LADFWDRHQLTDQTCFMEIIYAFEETDAFVLSDMKKAMALFKKI